MSTIGKLFGRSPFGFLQRHMEQVAKCVAKMAESLEAVERGSWEQAETLAEDASQLENQADEIKDDIRNKLSRRFFMPIDRAQILEILSIQDNLADIAEDVSILLTIKRIEIPAIVIGEFRRFRELNLATFELVKGIIESLDELLETGFGGVEAEKVRTVVHDVAYTEHQVDLIQRELLKKLFSDEAGLSAADLTMWLQLTKELAHLSNLSENLADRIQMILDVK